MVSNAVKDIINRLRVCRDGSLPLIGAICDRLELARQIDLKIDSDQNNRIISSGNAIKAMVMKYKIQ